MIERGEWSRVDVGTFDPLVFGYYDRGRLLYASRTRSGFTPCIAGGPSRKLNRSRLAHDLEVNPTCIPQNQMSMHVGRTTITRITRIVFLAWLIVTAILLWQTARRPIVEHHTPDAAAMLACEGMLK